MKLYIALLSFSLLSGCASLSESACKEGQWEEIGLADGHNGEKVDVIHSHIKSCAEYGIGLDTKLYRKGYERGLRFFCNPDKAFDLGYSGQEYNNVCTNKKFNSEYQLGYEIHNISKEIERISVEIERLKVDLEGANSNGFTSNKQTLRKEIKILKYKRSQLKNKLVLLTVKSGRKLENLVDYF